MKDECAHLSLRTNARVWMCTSFIWNEIKYTKEAFRSFYFSSHRHRTSHQNKLCLSALSSSDLAQDIRWEVTSTVRVRVCFRKKHFLQGKEGKSSCGFRIMLSAAKRRPSLFIRRIYSTREPRAPKSAMRKREGCGGEESTSEAEKASEWEHIGKPSRRNIQ